VALIALLPFSGLAEKVQSVEARNITLGIYSDDGSAMVALLKVARVFNENRRLGFFRVKLLPMVIAQGVRLEFAQPEPGTNWLAGFCANPAPMAKPGTRLEWREVSVRFPQDDRPRLQAAQLHPPAGTNAESCLLENITLQTDAGALTVPRARLMLKGLAGRVVWESQGVTQQWDLRTRNLISEKSKS
jgi:hypothetical protein